MNTKNSAYAILIADDDAASAQSLGDALGEIADVSLADNGEDAVSLIQSNNFNLIVLAAALPGLDGYSVCKQIKSDPRTKNIPVIFVSDMDNEKDMVMGLELGAVDYVVKPLFPQLLKLKAKNFLEQLPETPISPETSTAPPAAEAPPVTESPPVTETPPATEAPPVTEAPPPSRKSHDASKNGLKGGHKDPDAKPAASFGALFTSRSGMRAILGVFLILVGVIIGKFFNSPPQQPPAASIQAASVKQKKAPDLSWVKNVKCGQIPKVPWWKTVSHENIVQYVQSKHNGDWTPYIAKWERQLLIMKDVFHRKSAAKTKDGTRLEGKELEEHLGKLQQRLDATICLAEEAAKNN